MGELLARLSRQPAATARLLLASLLVNALGLASSLYVIQVLNRYVGHGVGGTLATLTVGVVVALVGEHVFRTLRLELAGEIVASDDEKLATGLFGLLLTARMADLDQRPRGEAEMLMRALEKAEAAFGPANLAAIADVPFSAFFLLVLALLSWPLALVAAGFAALSVTFIWISQRRTDPKARAAQAAAQEVAALVGAAAGAADAVRQFRAAPLLMGRWHEASGKARALRAQLTHQSSRSASTNQVLQGLMGAAVIAVGAMLAVEGKLDVGALIGANLIAARALAPIVRLAQLVDPLKQAEAGLKAARAFAAAIAVERDGGAVLAGFRGKLELRRLGWAPPGQPMPLFSALDLVLEPGSVLAVTGRNGSGKSSLTRLIVGLAEPDEGQVLADGVDIRQLAPAWWRAQVSYLPQEPVFLDGTIADNLAAARPGISEAEMRACLERAGLGNFVAEHPDGLGRRLALGGRSLALGLRRRLALARALAVDGQLVVLDEPSEGLDRDGVEIVYTLLIELARQGRTIIVVSHDANILAAAGHVLDLQGGSFKLTRGAP
ncbi:MAG: ATP-binding cassette domain-containing protein [Actinomycetota bacterium]